MVELEIRNDEVILRKRRHELKELVAGITAERNGDSPGGARTWCQWASKSGQKWDLKT